MRRSLWTWLAVWASVLLFGVASMSGARAAAVRSSFGDGIWTIGRGIVPGLYHTAGGDSCYWARLSGLSGSTNDIIVNENAAGPQTVLIKPRDAGFESQGCGTWHRIPKGPRPGLRRGPFEDGRFAIGIDLASGTYRTLGSDGCYWERNSDLGGATESAIANDNASGPVVLTIAPHDAAFVSKGCGTWRPIPVPVPGGHAGETRFGNGTWRIGIDIRPGIYRAPGGECYYATLSGFNGTTDDVIANNNVSGPVAVRLPANILGFQSKGCGIWTKVG